MLNQEVLQQIREQESRLEELENKVEIESLDFILRVMVGNKRFYMRKNQPQNYLRVTCIIPHGLESHTSAWPCKYQVWAKDKLIEEYNISYETYCEISRLPGWVERIDERFHSLVLKKHE